ncbi:stalk domain-containing protein [Paenibacillus sedimenti]|uniref:Copper amine oxidase-like N-terminal domain-containing protein n=1 Tax=Paenibacillus sedimenti TaxID=2770274 RepID=A0A926KVT9_9BACL|nr:stalk domain-containing protein [Paenibacillus sedimenti]MBD0382880.1 hypothetical protein [Paenibacillus sedimenti]
MKKFLLGLTCGIALTTTTAVFAADTIQTYLFPATFVINGETKNSYGYETLNYDGHAYVPIRFIAESMGLKVVYEDVSKTITVDNGFNILDINNSGVSAGHLSIIKEGNHSSITGKLYIGIDSWNHRLIDSIQSLNPTVDYTKTIASGKLVFWNEKGEVIEKVPYQISNVLNGAEQIVPLETTSKTDISDYAAVTLESTNPFYGRVPDLHAEISTKDSENKVQFGLVNLLKTGEYTLVRGFLSTINQTDVSPDAKITITFLNDKGVSLGTATTTLSAEKPETQQLPFAVFLGRGDLTKYKSITIQVGK